MTQPHLGMAHLDISKGQLHQSSPPHRLKPWGGGGGLTINYLELDVYVAHLHLFFTKDVCPSSAAVSIT